MPVLQLKGLELLPWETVKVCIRRTDVKQVTLQEPVYSTQVVSSRVKIYGLIEMKLPDCGRIVFGWIARQDIAIGGTTRHHEYEVDFSEPNYFKDITLVDHCGAPVLLTSYPQVGMWLARHTAPLWSASVSHYLKSLR